MRHIMKKQEEKEVIMKRQGDVLFKKITNIPVETTLKKDNVLVYGESTGHAHRLVGGKVYQTPDNLLYLLIANKGNIVHPEHKTINLSKGKWAVIRQREYTNKDAVRLVID